MKKRSLKNFQLKGAYYSLEFKGISNRQDFALLESVHRLFTAADLDGDHRDIRSFDAQVEALLPEGYISGGGAHHLWIHRASDAGKRPGAPEFGIWAFQNVDLFYKYVDRVKEKGK